MAVAVRSRRQIQRRTTQRGKDRAAKRKGRWFSKRIKIPEESIRVHFQRPTEPYPDPWNPEDLCLWKMGAKHYIPKLNKFTECALDECLTCAYREPQDFGFEGVKAQKFLEDSWPGEYYSLNVWVEEWHVVVEREGKKKNDDGSLKTFFERVLENEAKRELKEQGYELSEVDLPRVFGFHGFLDISSAAWKNEFTAAYEEIELYTKDGGFLVPMYYGCANCGEPFFAVASQCPNCESEEVGIDHENYKAFCGDCESEWELLEHRSKPLKKKTEIVFDCKECGHKEEAVPVYACLNPETGELDTEIPEDGWDSHDIFDVQITLRTQKSKDQSPPRIVIDKWEFKDPNKRLFMAKYQGGVDDEDAKKVAERHSKPFDLAMVHAPDNPAVQSKILKLENLFGEKGGTMSRKAIRYSKNTEEEEPEDDAEGNDDDE